MGERQRAIQRRRLRTKMKMQYACHSDEFYTTYKHNIRPLYFPRWMTYDAYICYFREQDKHYLIIDRAFVTYNVLLAPKWMSFLKVGFKIERMYWNTVHFFLRNGVKHKIIDPEVGVRFSWKWLWEGYKKARRNRHDRH